MRLEFLTQKNDFMDLLPKAIGSPLIHNAKHMQFHSVQLRRRQIDSVNQLFKKLNSKSYLYKQKLKNLRLFSEFKIEGTMKTAILLGATGLTGGILLQKLLEDPVYEKVILFSRSPVAVRDEKIEEHLIDMFRLDEYIELFKADDVFCCIGTTKSKTPDKETYRKIDFGIPGTAARLCKENGINTFLVISALGADENSSVFYNKIKGEMEEAVLSQNIENTYIFQPSLISGDREEKRFFENLAKNAMKIVNYFMLGPLKKYRSIHPETIAKAMLFVAKQGYEKNRIESDEIKKIASIH